METQPAGLAVRTLVRHFSRTWLSKVSIVRRNPLHAPSDPPYRRAGIVYFVVLSIASLTLLGVLATGSPRYVDFLIPVLIVALVTGLADIQLTPERATLLNDLFYVVPFVFFPLPASAMLLLLVAAVDPIVNPRSLARTCARLSSMLPNRLCQLGGVVIGHKFIPADQWWTWAVIAMVGMAGVRVHDYFLFPISLRLGIGPRFSYGDYLRSVIAEDQLLFAIELPIIAVAATAYPHSPLLLVALVIPYLAMWRVALLRPSVDALREANDLKSRFLSTASHDMRTPLTTISGFGSILADSWDDIPDQERRRIASMIVDQSQRLLQLVEELLTLSTIEAGVMTTGIVDVELRPVLDHGTAAAGRPDITPTCPTGLHVRADPNHLERIVINLVANAVKYGEDPIEIDARPGAPGRVEIRIRDHGPGIAADFRERMFDEFARGAPRVTGGPGGTGLGLGIVLRLVAEQHGTIRYEDVEPTGACFVIELDRVEE